MIDGCCKHQWLVLIINFSGRVKAKKERLLASLRKHIASPNVDPPFKKVFIQKHPEVPLLLEYSGAAPVSWWQH